MKDIQKFLDTMEPTEALAAVTPQLKKILSSLDQEALISFVTGLVDRPGGDKTSSMVNL